MAPAMLAAIAPASARDPATPTRGDAPGNDLGPFMPHSQDRLPPLQALLFFESAARHLNFTTAAEELGTTQPAVSLRVRSMEDHLGVRLFRRLHRGVTLTDEGLRLYEAVSSSLATLRSATTDMRSRQKPCTLTLATDFGFAKLWLLPRMQALRAALPDLQLRVLTSQAQPGARDDDVDLAIVFGPPPAQGEAELLFRERAVPVCSPALLAGRSAAPRELPLLHLHQAEQARWLGWDDWFEARGSDVVRSAPSLTFNDYSMVVEAAVAGHGVALGWSPLVDDLLARGELVAVHDEPLQTARGYFLTAPRDGGRVSSLPIP